MVGVVAGVGINDMVGLSTTKGKRDESYIRWKSMLSRCYLDSSLSKREAYKDVIVCREWHTYSNFYGWYNKQAFKNIGYQLDKDLLQKGANLYSPETCVLLPMVLNQFVSNRLNNSRKGLELPVGVYFNKAVGLYRAQISIDNERKFLGSFNTIEEAFTTFKIAKEERARVLAFRWKEKIDDKAHQALLNYTVNIED